jgi:hypothetical protein
VQLLRKKVARHLLLEPPLSVTGMVHSTLYSYPASNSPPCIHLSLLQNYSLLPLYMHLCILYIHIVRMTQGSTGMRYSLVSREVIADSIEVMHEVCLCYFQKEITLFLSLSLSLYICIYICVALFLLSYLTSLSLSLGYNRLSLDAFIPMFPTTSSLENNCHHTPHTTLCRVIWPMES